ncbi:MAG: hypothetical protein ACYS8W_03870 [Planctomycetota bacterium]|jgi:hypothetical protein
MDRTIFRFAIALLAVFAVALAGCEDKKEKKEEDILLVAAAMSQT